MKQQFVVTHRYKVLQETADSYSQCVLIYVFLSKDLMMPHIQDHN